MIQIWSFESTDTPIVFPITQWFGSGFGHSGFTSNLGACPPAAAATARLWSTAEPTPSAATTATRPAPTLSLCVITISLRALLPILFSRTLDTIHDFAGGDQRLAAPCGTLWHLGESWVSLKSPVLRILGPPVDRARMSDT